MGKDILIVSPHPAFGELLRLSLEESGSYRIRLVQTWQEAQTALGVINYHLIVLDMESDPAAFVTFGRQLMVNNPALKLIVIPPGNNPDHPAIAGLKPHAYLNKPFYLPDLTAIIERLLHLSEDRQTGDVFPTAQTQPWMDDVNLAAQRLTRLLIESSAEAALITRSGKRWAYAGQLEEDAVNEVTSILGRALEKEPRTDLARFIRLESTDSEYLLYAKPLGARVLLALVYDVTTPLTRIRSQAGQLARALVETTAIPPVIEPISIPIPTPPPAPVTRDYPSEEKSTPEAGWMDEPVDPEMFAAFTRMLGDVPSPDPEVESWWAPEEPLPEEFKPSVDETSPHRIAPPMMEPMKEDRKPAGVPIPSKPLVEMHPDTQRFTPPIPRTLEELDPAVPGLSYILYTCILVPRLPSHYLTGDLASQLARWIPEICLAYGWRLDGIATRPEYFQFTVRVTPSVSPGNLIRVLRQQTSQRIFGFNTTFKEQNPSGDFWAPGYLIITGSQPPAGDLLRDFLHETRHRQGLTSS